MVAHTRTGSMLTVTLLRNGEVLDSRAAPNGREALKLALLVIASQDELIGGEVMTVEEA
jgi:hypothetical protein